MRTLSRGKRWYAAATQPNREPFAIIQLQAQGFESFFPKRLKTVRHARKQSKRIVSFFPGYVFVALDLGVDRWRSVNGTFGVRSLVMSGDRPLPAPDGVVENLQTMTDEQGFLQLVEDLRHGDTVRVIDGPLADMVGRIDRLDGNHRVRVLLDMLHGKMPTVMERSNIMKHDTPRAGTRTS